MSHLHDSQKSDSSENGAIEKVSTLLSNELIEAVQRNDLEKLKNLKISGMCFSDRNAKGDTLLHLAVKQQKVEVFDYLLTLDEIDIDALNSDGKTPLLECFHTEERVTSEDFALKLLSHDCDIKLKEKTLNDTALHGAAFSKWYKTCEILIEKGADVEWQNAENETPLYKACQSGFIDGIYLLLYHGAVPFVIKDSNSGPPSCSCFDHILGLLAEKPELHDVLFCLLPYGVDHLHMGSVKDAMIIGTSLFPEIIDDVPKLFFDFDYDSVSCFFQLLFKYKPEWFRLFVEKYEFLFKEMVACGDGFVSIFSFGGKLCERHFFPRYVENFFTLFSNKAIVSRIVEKVNKRTYFDAFANIYYTTVLFCDTDKLAKLTELSCLMASCGINVSAHFVELVFNRYGYCELFKMMLHMDLRHDLELEYDWRDEDVRASVVVKLVYDVSLQVDRLVDMNYFNIGCLNEICDYFTLPDLVVSFPILKYYRKNFSYVPSLLELARNVARKFIMDRFNVKNSRQFYTILKHLPIANCYKQIISYERKLYPENFVLPFSINCVK